jgi:hypothetical protein
MVRKWKKVSKCLDIYLYCRHASTQRGSTITGKVTLRGLLLHRQASTQPCSEPRARLRGRSRTGGVKRLSIGVSSEPCARPCHSILVRGDNAEERVEVSGPQPLFLAAGIPIAESSRNRTCRTVRNPTHRPLGNVARDTQSMSPVWTLMGAMEGTVNEEAVGPGRVTYASPFLLSGRSPITMSHDGHFKAYLGRNIIRTAGPQGCLCKLHIRSKRKQGIPAYDSCWFRSLREQGYRCRRRG